MQEYAQNAQAVGTFGSHSWKQVYCVPWYAHICTCKKALHSTGSCTAGPWVMADGDHKVQGGTSGSQTQRCCFIGELSLRPQSVGWDPGEMRGYRRLRAFELLAHVGTHCLCQESEAAFTCEKHWGASCLPVSHAQMYFSPRQEFCLWTSCAYLFHKNLFSFVSLMFWT